MRPSAWLVAVLASVASVGSVASVVAACGSFSSPDEAPPSDAAPGDTLAPDGNGADSEGPSSCPPREARATDPKHCGACDHDCLGGACAAGKCQPLRLATPPMNAVSIAATSNGVYWVADNAGAVWRCPLEGCTGAPVVHSSAVAGTVALVPLDGDLAVLGHEWLYAVTAAGATRTLNAAGKYKDAKAITGDDKAFVYVVADVGTTNVLRVAYADGARTILDGMVNGRRVAYGGQRLYWDHDVTIAPMRSCVLPGCVLPFDEIVTVPSTDAPELAASSSELFWSSNSAGKLSKCAGTGCTAPVVLHTQAAITSLAVDATHVYFTTGTDSNSTVSRCPQTGCGPLLEVLVPGHFRPHAIFVTAKAIYWASEAFSGADASSEPHGLWRLAK